MEFHWPKEKERRSELIRKGFCRPAVYAWRSKPTAQLTHHMTGKPMISRSAFCAPSAVGRCWTF